MSATEESRPASRAGRPPTPHRRAAGAPPRPRPATPPWPDEDLWRGLRAEAREEERDWAQWEAEREEPATEDGAWEA